MTLTKTLLQSAIALLVLTILYAFLRILHSLFLHPLRSFPGPLSTSATIVALQKAMLEGTFSLWLHKLHLEYGSTVRYAPNELSFIHSAVWKDVYGSRTTNLFSKQKLFYSPDIFGDPPGILRADTDSHARQRKLVAHAFSDKALRQQEFILKHYAKLLIEKLTKAAWDHGEVDLARFYNFTTFDIMTDLTFLGVIKRWPLTNALLQRCLPKARKEKLKHHLLFSVERVNKRLRQKTDRPDFLTYILRHREDENGNTFGLAASEMYSNAGLFMIAGTETTATVLSGITYYLHRNPQKLARLQAEVRNAFESIDNISMMKLSQMRYLCACVEEGLRVYPPVPGIIPRETPEAGANVAGRWVPGGTVVSIANYAAYHSPSNFKDPDAFVPKRWLPEGQYEYGADNKQVFNPFSYGPRNCLGKKHVLTAANLAYHEMRLILASVILSFDMELCKEAEHWIQQKNYIVWEKPDMKVKIAPVTN
ncbi:cytochrome P450 ClCP1 [Bimuria novae-zelandiae CBS 107.79]|uniref:Cytochrome P450 ClCP1 n=1 Tax=Bimuria novae-zelandiae CBS 107.79 TaxID=1447943 RepID=A0A6A5V991_9PLEO|nr:cytochrome P450 ClCP1 [Bimuria novae-zelandiae CBS 107.79]